METYSCFSRLTISRFILALMAATSVSSALAQSPQKWVTSWTGSVQGPYPIGNPSAQPDLRFAFPSPEIGARDQSFRLIVRPDLWGRQVRLRFSNALGTRSVTFDGVLVGLQQGAAMLVAGSNQPVSFAGRRSTTIAPGLSVWSDAVSLPFVHEPAAPELLGRKLAFSFHVAGESGPMTWHAKALTTSYLTAPGAGAKGDAEDEQEFSFSTASWYFLDALDMMAPAPASTIVALGDSITDGTASTMNGDDRWPDVLARRLHAVHGNKIAVVNAGIGGNQVVGPATYSPQTAVSRRTVGQGPARPRCTVAVRRCGGHLARRHQRFQQERQCLGRGGRGGHEGRRQPYPRQIFRCPDHRRHRHPGAREHQRQSRFARRGRQAQGAQPVHPRGRPV
jgi:hypothetical protein